MVEKHLQGRLDRELQGMLLDDSVERADAYKHRAQQPEASARFGELLVDPVTGELRSYASLIEPAVKAAAQLELGLTQYAKRAEIRRMLAEKIELEVVPVLPLPWIAKIPEKLRNARKSGTFGIHALSGKGIVLWDEKASLSRLCPDDAREEGSRLQKRYTPQIEKDWADGCHVQYAVFTMPNFAQGKLAFGMKKIMTRFRNLIMRKDRDGNRVFPEIEGAIAVLEAPMAWDRSWNVHVNVMLVVRGFCDYKKLRELWHWNVHFKKLPTGDLEALRKSFRELIKYSVQATSEKSEEKLERGRADVDGADPLREADTWPADGMPVDPVRAAAPPMLAWTGQELGEWLMAMHRFRRTRSYGSLYGAPKPEAADLQEFVWIGSVRLRGGAYRLSVRLLDSIPEDKSSPAAALDRWHRWRAMLKRGPTTGCELDAVPLERFAHPAY